jgi:hypothetical protein
VVAVITHTLAAEHGREAVRFGYLILWDDFVAALGLTNDEFTNLKVSLVKDEFDVIKIGITLT